MPTFTRTYLKDKSGNYIAISGLADMIHHADGETTEEKIRKLKAEMNDAVAKQDFENAAKIRDEIKVLEGGENK